MAVGNHHPIKARHVKFDFGETPLQWIPGDPESTHIIDTLNLLFPEGELWFCRVYNKALPLIDDPALHADADGFLRQEAVHSRSHHAVAKQCYARHGVDTQPYTRRLTWLFSKVLGEAPLGLKIGHTRFWLRQQLGIIAALEHFFAYLGRWVLNARELDEARADPAMLDLLRWHGAEEVEHGTVAFDLHRYMGGGYFGRAFHMLLAIALLVLFVSMGSKFMIRAIRARAATRGSCARGRAARGAGICRRSGRRSAPRCATSIRPIRRTAKARPSSRSTISRARPPRRPPRTAATGERKRPPEPAPA